MKIALIGYRGTGKSEAAKILARRLSMDLINLDQAIVDKAGKPIPQIVEDHGWDHFRDLETRVLAEALEQDNLILDCGGGIIVREKNRNMLKNAGPVIWLTATVPVIIGRIKEDANRPSLTEKSFTEEVQEVLEQRQPLYKECASHEIATDNITPEQVAEKIIDLTGPR